MTSTGNSAIDLVDLMIRRAPEYVDLITAETEMEFAKAFDTILEKSVASLETNKRNFATLDEVGLTGALVMGLSIPGLSVTQETNSNGHVDLTIIADHCQPIRKILGEAKIYRGPATHIAGIQQLLGRYTTGREVRGLMIVYVRKRNISDLIQKLRGRMDKDCPCSQEGKTSDYQLKWSFITTHRLSSGNPLQVGHIGCNLYIE